MGHPRRGGLSFCWVIALGIVATAAVADAQENTRGDRPESDEDPRVAASKFPRTDRSTGGKKTDHNSSGRSPAPWRLRSRLFSRWRGDQRKEPAQQDDAMANRPSGSHLPRAKVDPDVKPTYFQDFLISPE